MVDKVAKKNYKIQKRISDPVSIGIGAALTERSPPTPPGKRVRTGRFE